MRIRHRNGTAILGPRGLTVALVIACVTYGIVACDTEGPAALSNGQTLPPGSGNADGSVDMPIITNMTDGSAGNDDGSASDLDGGGGADGSIVRDFSNDRSKFFGQARCAGSGLQLCDDFETGMIDPATWTMQGAGGLTVDTVQAARGLHALHITKNGNGASYIKETKTFPALNNRYWGRVMVYFNKLPIVETYNDAAFNYSHWTFAAATGTGVTGEIRLSGQMNGAGKSFFGVGTDSTPSDAGTGDWTESDKDPMPPNQVPKASWLCIEWEHDGSKNETHFYWDATEHPSLATTTTTPATNGGNSNPYILPQFTQVWVGWQEYQSSDEPFEMWLDSVAIDPNRIGCIQ